MRVRKPEDQWPPRMQEGFSIIPVGFSENEVYREHKYTSRMIKVVK